MSEEIKGGFISLWLRVPQLPDSAQLGEPLVTEQAEIHMAAKMT